MTLLEVEHVSKSYFAEGGGVGLVVLRDVSLSLDPGQSAAIIGPSGSGKSTLLNIIGSLDQPSMGSVRVAGRDLSDLDDAAAADLRYQSIGFVFQSHHLLPQLTVLENVLIPVLAQRRPNAADEDYARQMLERVDLVQRLNYRPGQLSGGERQRVAVVRALINRPALLLADEPTGDLDEATAQRLHKLLQKMHKECMLTSVIATHNARLAAGCDRVLRLAEGRLVQV